jgi:ribosomal protein S27E
MGSETFRKKHLSAALFRQLATQHNRCKCGNFINAQTVFVTPKGRLTCGPCAIKRMNAGK